MSVLMCILFGQPARACCYLLVMVYWSHVTVFQQLSTKISKLSHAVMTLMVFNLNYYMDVNNDE
jgi:hypothetical protein